MTDTLAELNKLMAEKVRGWRLSNVGGVWLDGDDFVCGEHMLFFTTDMNQAMMCANKYLADGWCLSISSYEVYFYPRNTPDNEHISIKLKSLDDIPEAICQAIAKALEATQ